MRDECFVWMEREIKGELRLVLQCLDKHRTGAVIKAKILEIKSLDLRLDKSDSRDFMQLTRIGCYKKWIIESIRYLVSISRHLTLLGFTLVTVPTSPKTRRHQLQLNDDVPSQTEVQSYLGSSLAEVFKDYSHDTTRNLLGVVPPLHGCQEEAWISPSDQLIGKVALKPPLTNKFIKACTHQGILEIGELAALRFEEMTEDNMRKRLQEEMIETRKMFNAEKRRAVELNVEQVRREYEEYIKELNEDFAKKLQTALEEATKKSNKELQKAVVRERMEVTMQMMKKLRDEIGHVVDSLEVEFQQSLRAQRHNMIADFNAIMRRERSSADATMKILDQKKADEIFAQRRELEMENMADAASIICAERMRCSSEKHEMHQCFEKQIEALQKLLADSTKISSEEETTQVQKSRKNDAPEIFQVVEIIDKDKNRWRPIELDPEIPQLDCTEEEPTFSIGPSEQNLFPAEHYDRISKPSAKSLRSYESLPFCYVENKLYVRSDYKRGNQKVPEEKKKMSELAEGARFVIEFKRTPKSCL